MAFRRAAASAAKRLARNARGTAALQSYLPAAAIAAECPALQRAQASQLAFTRPFAAAAAEPAPALSDTVGNVVQVCNALAIWVHDEHYLVGLWVASSPA